MIPGRCRDCGAKRPLADFADDAEVGGALAAALECPAPLARLIVPYLALHAPRGKAMQQRKLRRLLEELPPLLNAGTVTREGDTRPAPLAVWQQSLEDLLAEADSGKLDLPLSGHGLLISIAWRRAPRHQAPALVPAGDAPAADSPAAAPHSRGRAAFGELDQLR